MRHREGEHRAQGWGAQGLQEPLLGRTQLDTHPSLGSRALGHEGRWAGSEALPRSPPSGKPSFPAGGVGARPSSPLMETLACSARVRCLCVGALPS